MFNGCRSDDLVEQATASDEQKANQPIAELYLHLVTLHSVMCEGATQAMKSAGKVGFLWEKEFSLNE